jgi:hypothetical protein
MAQRDARRGLALALARANCCGMTKLAALPHGAVLAIEGEDRTAFLQGLVSNDVDEATPGTPVLCDAVEFGTMRSGRDQLGLAVLRLDRPGAALVCATLVYAALVCDGATLTPRLPDWLRQD